MSELADIIYELEHSTRDVEERRQAYEQATQDRHKLIKRALSVGVKQADIARLTGLSRARIAQLR